MNQLAILGQQLRLAHAFRKEVENQGHPDPRPYMQGSPSQIPGSIAIRCSEGFIDFQSSSKGIVAVQAVHANVLPALVRFPEHGVSRHGGIR